MKSIVLVGGGTAGHIVPNLALVPYLEKQFKIHYICADNDLDKRYLAKEKFKIFNIPVVKLERKFTFKNLLILFKLSKSIKKAKHILKEIQPSVVFSKGGYVGLPVAYACKKLKIPIILHESDYTMGLANRLAQKYASLILTTFSDTKTKFNEKTICVGTPIKQEILQGNKNNLTILECLHKTRKTILVFGGSQGARFFNDFFIKNSNEICSKYNVVLLTGKQDISQLELPKNFIKLESVDNIQDYYDLADLIITRGGANALFEILQVNKPMIIIPLPSENSRGDQLQNAIYFEKKKYAKMLLQKDCSMHNLLNLINEVIQQSHNNNHRQTNTVNKKIVELINKVSNQS